MRDPLNATASVKTISSSIFYLKKVRRSAFNGGWLLLAGHASGFLLIKRFPVLLRMPCPVKATLHIPCPACGTSRSIAALGHFDLATAFSLNPLFTVAFIISLFLIVNALLQALSGYRAGISALPISPRLALVVLLVLNQLYLVLAGL